MISQIGAKVLMSLANGIDIGDQFRTALAIASIVVVVSIIAMHLSNILQPVIQGI